jgi:DNA-binding transcriptional LysR family regulator
LPVCGEGWRSPVAPPAGFVAISSHSSQRAPRALRMAHARAMDICPAGSGAHASDGRKPGRDGLAVGCFASICRDRLADELLAFSRLCPAIDIGVHEMQRGALLSALKAGDLSLAVLPGKEEIGFRSVEIWRDRVMVALPLDHPLAARDAVQPSELQGEPMLVSTGQFGSDMHRFLAGRVLPLGPVLDVKFVELGPARILQRIADGVGIALVCESHAAQIGDRVAIRPIAAAHAPFPVRAYWTDEEPAWPLSCLIRSLIDSV